MTVRNSDLSFRALSSDYFIANQLIDEIKSGNLSSVIRFLERKQVNWNVILPEYGVAPLHFLAGREDEGFAVAVLSRALKSGGDPNARTEDGLTPVHLAAMWGRCRILELLLTHGADPELVDWDLCLNAEEYALKEHQYQAYSVLSTYSVICDDVDRFSKYLGEESESKSSSPRNETALTNDADKKIVPAFDDYDYSDNDNDWLDRTKGYLPINDKARDMIKEHRRGTRLYEDPKENKDTYRDCWENVLSELPKRNTKESIYETSVGFGNGGMTDKHKERFDGTNYNGDICVRRLQPIYEEIKDDCVIGSSKSVIPKRHKKRRSLSKCTEESEVFLHGFEELASYQTIDRKSKSRPHGSSITARSSEESVTSEVHNRVLCKMSRIYLFMLKKRRIFQRTKQSLKEE